MIKNTFKKLAVLSGVVSMAQAELVSIPNGELEASDREHQAKTTLGSWTDESGGAPKVTTWVAGDRKRCIVLSPSMVVDHGIDDTGKSEFSGSQIWNGGYLNGWSELNGSGVVKSLNGDLLNYDHTGSGVASTLDGTLSSLDGGGSTWDSINDGDWTFEVNLKLTECSNGFNLWLGTDTNLIRVEIYADRTQNVDGTSFNVSANNEDGQFHTFRVSHDSQAAKYHVWRDGVLLTPVGGVDYDAPNNDSRLLLGDITINPGGDDYLVEIASIAYTNTLETQFLGSQIWDASYQNQWSEINGGGISNSLNGTALMLDHSGSSAASTLDGSSAHWGGGSSLWDAINSGDWTMEVDLKLVDCTNGFALWCGTDTDRIIVHLYPDRTESASGSFIAAHNNVDGAYHTFRIQHDGSARQYHVWRDDVLLTTSGPVSYDASDDDSRLLFGDTTSGTFGDDYQVELGSVTFRSNAFPFYRSSTIKQTVTVPDTRKSEDVDVLPLDSYYGMIGVDVYGLTAAGAGNYTVTLRSVEDVDDGQGGTTIVKTDLVTKVLSVDSVASTSTWAVIDASSNLIDAGNAIDHTTSTGWDSTQALDAPAEHHWTLDLGSSQLIEGVIYQLNHSNGSGYMKDYAIYVSEDSANFPAQPVLAGTMKWFYTTDPRYLYFDTPVQGRYIKMVGKSDAQNGTTQFNASIDEFSLIEEPEASFRRDWVYIPPSVMSSLGTKNVELEIAVTNGDGIVFGRAELYRFHQSPTTALTNSAHKSNGPDQLTAGAYGFRYLAEDYHRATSVLSLFSGKAAESAGLSHGDLLVGINGVALRRHRAVAGWEGLHHPFGAQLGHAVAAATESSVSAQDYGKVTLNILRPGATDYTTHDLVVQLPHTLPALQDTLTSSDPTYQALHSDMASYLASQQQSNGFWPGNRMRSGMAGMAMLGTNDLQYAENIHRYAYALLNGAPDPETRGDSFFYQGVELLFMVEYCHATGDERAKKWVVDTFEWLPNAAHLNRYGKMGMGHGHGGLPYSNRGLMAPVAHLLAAEALAIHLGVHNGTLWETCEASIVHSWSDPATGGHGAMGYNAAYRDSAEFWARTGLCTMALHFRDENPVMRNAMLNALITRHPWSQNSHAYGEPGSTLGFMGLAATDPASFQKIFREWNWKLHVTWEPGHGLYYSTPHKGAPYMDSDILMNANFCALFSMANGGLNCTGGNPGQWLPENTDISLELGVTITQNSNGLITVMSSISGSEIYITTDGALPTLDSLKYTEPFQALPGMQIRVRAYDPVSQTFYGASDSLDIDYNYSPLSVIDASGFSFSTLDPAYTQQVAIDRASLAFDGDVSTVWKTNNGEEKQNWESTEVLVDEFGAETPDPNVSVPHYVAVDFGEDRELHHVRLHYVSEGNTPNEIEIYASADGVNWGDPVQTWSMATYASSQTLSLTTPLTTRYLKFNFPTPFNATSVNLLIQEIEFIDLAPTITIDEVTRMMTLSGPAGFDIRYTLDSRLPDGSSSLYSSPVNLGDAGVIVHAYLFPSGGSEVDGNLAVATLNALFDMTTTLAVASSQWDNTVSPDKAVDGDPATYWHSERDTPFPHHITIDLGEVKTFNGFSYLPKQLSNEVTRANELYFYTSLDGSFGAPTWSGLLSDQGYALSTDHQRDVYLNTEVTARYIRIEARDSAANSHLQYFAAAEIGLLHLPGQQQFEGILTLDYNHWLQMYGGSAGDGDSLSDDLEFVFGLSPVSNDGAMAYNVRTETLDVGQGDKEYTLFEIRENTRARGLSIQLQVSYDLVGGSWKSIEQAVTDNEVELWTTATDNEGVRVNTYRSIQDSSLQSRIFFRVSSVPEP